MKLVTKNVQVKKCPGCKYIIILYYIQHYRSLYHSIYTIVYNIVQQYVILYTVLQVIDTIYIVYIYIGYSVYRLQINRIIRYINYMFKKAVIN